jgi:hypothetical protein
MNAQAKAVSALVSKYTDKSLQHGSAKQRKQFDSLSKADKRAWREALQRQIAALKNRVGARSHRRAFQSKPRGKNAHKINRTSRLEENLFNFVRGSTDYVERQGYVKAAAMGVSAALAVTGTYHMYKRLSRMAEAVANTTEKVSSHFTDAMARFKQHFNDFVDSLKKVKSWLSKFAICAVGLWFLNRYVNAPAVALVVTSVVLASVPEASHMFGIQKQSYDTSCNLIALLFTLLAPSLGGKYGFMANAFMRTISNFPKFSEGLPVFMDKVMDIVEQAIQWVLKRTTGGAFSFNRKLDLATKWRNEVLAMCSEVDTQAKVTLDTVHAMQRKVQEGYGLMQLMTHRQSKDEIARYIDRLNSRLAPHLGTLASENNMRVMPYCAMLGGGSGIGKTSVVQVYAAMILVLSGEVRASEVLQNLWQKGISEYWNGYLGQRAIIKDDCFQVRGVPGAQDSEAMELIRAIGNWACPLNYADVDSKGRYYLDVALIVGTTNASNIRADWEPFITCPEALVRRFQGAYWLELNKEYMNEQGRFDYEKVSRVYASRLAEFSRKATSDPSWKPTEDDVLDLFPWDAWTVHIHDFSNSNPLNGPVFPGGMKQAVKDAANTIRTRKIAHRESVNNISEHIRVAESVIDGLFVDHQAGGKIVGELRATTSQEFQSELVNNHPGESVGYFTVDVTGKLTADENGEPVLLDLERRDATFCEVVRANLLKWANQFMSGVGSTLEATFGPAAYVGEDGAVQPNFTRAAVELTLCGLALTCVFKLVHGAVSMLWGMVEALFKAVGITTVQSNAPNASPKEKGLKKFDFPRVALQLGSPPQEHVHDNVYNNMYAIGYDECGEYVPIGNILGIGGQVFVMPAHFDDYLRKNAAPNADVVLIMCSNIHTIVRIPLRVFQGFRRARFDQETDLVGIAFDKHAPIRQHRNIVGYFLKESEISNILRGTNVAVRLDIGRRKKDTDIVRTTLMSQRSEYVPVVSANDGSRLASLIRYDMPTMSGDCGAPLMLSENRYYGGRSIMGMHVAGKTTLLSREGYSVIVTQECMREVWLRLGPSEAMDTPSVHDHMRVVTNEEFVELEAGLVAKGIIGGSMSYLGPLEEPVNLAPKTALIPSPMHDDEPFGPCPVAPAVLYPVMKDGERVFPMARAVEAYQSSVVVKDPAILDIAAEVAFKPLMKVTQDYPRDVLSFEEAIVPPEGWKLKPLNRKSSAGYKYRHHVTPSTPGKVAFLGKEGDVDFSNPALNVVRKDVEAIISSARQGIRLPHLCTDFLKDELRPLEKVEAVKTRMISGTELDYTIAVRMYFGAFNAAMLATPIVNGMAPGINHYTQWGELASRLTAKGGAVFDGDFSRFDASEQPWVHMRILDVINKWYAARGGTPEDDKIRAVLWDDLIHSVHITGDSSSHGQLVQWHKSLPSGHPLTTVVNSMYSLLSLTACYIHLTGDTRDMWEHAFINTFGDDNITGVDDSVKDVFNQVTVAHAMKELFDLTYTAGAKDGKLVPYTDIYNVTFLKRSFLRDEETMDIVGSAPCLDWVGPLAKESFLYTPYYYRNKKDPRQDITNNCEVLLGELALHPREVWDTYFPALKEWCARNNIDLAFESRSAARAYITTRFDVWF